LWPDASKNNGAGLMYRQSNQDSGMGQAKGGVSWKRVARLFITYWAIAFMIVVLSFFAIAELVTLKLAYILLGITIVVAAVATFVHIRQGKKDHVDEVAKKIS
jgi:hypothetical protein